MTPIARAYRLHNQTVTATEIARGNTVKPSGDAQALVSSLDEKFARASR